MSCPALDDKLPAHLIFRNAPTARTFQQAKLQHQPKYSEQRPRIPQGFQQLHDNVWPLYPEVLRRCVIADDTRVLKYVRKGMSDLESEKHALDIVREQTGVPVPRAISYSATKDFQQLEMHRIDGETLEDCWATLSDQERRNIARQVIAYSRDLHKLQNTMVSRAITSRGTIIGRIPFEKPLSARDFIVSWTTRYSKNPKVLSFIEERLCFCDQTIVLTHLDLYPANIIVKERVVSALIDFESCVYVPKFWGALEIFRRAAQRPDRWFTILKEEFSQHLDADTIVALEDLARLYVAFGIFAEEDIDPIKREESRDRGWQLVRDLVGIGQESDTPEAEYEMLAPLTVDHP
ncbi:hypothetical protein HYFRA_00004958 [Hymenoscyphus fraxineus]|uniref:Aminoglycoside phosphotransferase domain-containing protein n=1 Tax=Hymenoscyphus fraxineus TaxID=746836 RepID=A0A9N9KPN5_9HELO|nr:hypothetical protein HYFRA_00004958 [Hymenoscyphus fraxineus]